MNISVYSLCKIKFYEKRSIPRKVFKAKYICKLAKLKKYCLPKKEKHKINQNSTTVILIKVFQMKTHLKQICPNVRYVLLRIDIDFLRIQQKSREIYNESGNSNKIDSIRFIFLYIFKKYIPFKNKNKNK